MRRALKPALLLALAALAACGEQRPPIDVDLVPPVLASAQPSGSDVPVDAVFKLRFSEPIKRDTVYWPDAESGGEVADSVVIAKQEDEDYVLSAVNNPPLSTTQRGKTVAAALTFSSDRKSIDLAPLARLDGNTPYVILVSRKLTDDVNNKLVNAETKANETLAVRFVTAPAPDVTRPTMTLKTPAAGARGVAVDLETVDVLFSEAMDENSWSPGSVTLREEGSGNVIVPAEAAWAESVLTLVLPPNAGAGCGTLCPGLAYTLQTDESVTDLAGNPVGSPATPQTFTAATCTDTAPPRVAAAVAVPSDTSATIRWKTDEPSSSAVDLVVCDGGGCLAPQFTGEGANCTVDTCNLPSDEASFSCEHTVKVTGLEPQKTYTVVAISADPGRREGRSAELTFTTLAPLPKVVISELFATPQGLTDANRGKFVELYNGGSVPVDLKDWALGRCADPGCATITNRWTIKAATTGGPTTLAPGAFAVAHGKAFDATVMGLPAGTLQLAGSSDTLLANGLTSTTAYTYVLLSPGGATPVSSYAAHLGRPNLTANNGRSFERKALAGEDAASNWAVSTSALPGAAGNFATPGLANSVTP